MLPTIHDYSFCYSYNTTSYSVVLLNSTIKKITTTSTSCCPPLVIGTELRTLLMFYGIPSKEHGKNVSAMRGKYAKLKEENAKPVSYMKWTVPEEERLMELKEKEIELKDTELGRQRQEQINDAKKTLDSMDPMERIDLLKKYAGEEAVEEEVREVTQCEDE